MTSCGPSLNFKRAVAKHNNNEQKPEEPLRKTLKEKIIL